LLGVRDVISANICTFFSKKNTSNENDKRLPSSMRPSRMKQIADLIRISMVKLTLSLHMEPRFQYNDGGRAQAGYKGSTGDCAVRSAAIATMVPYQTLYDKINELAKSERRGVRKTTISNARTGVHKQTMHKLMNSLGWKFIPTMSIGSGCKVHLRSDELPSGRLVLSLSKHYAAFIDGVLHDTHDCSRMGTRCVYGYWIKAE
jgi:hypothetical protein